MSASYLTNHPSPSGYTQIFVPALNKYQKLTGQDLGTHAFSRTFDNFESTNAVSDVLRDQMKAFDGFRNGNEALMTWLESIVDLLFMVSAKLEESIEAVSVRVPLSVLQCHNVRAIFLVISTRKNDMYCYHYSPRRKRFQNFSA